MATIYLIRHAQSRPRWSEPQMTWRLSATGRAQAARLAGLLRPLGIRHVFSSPYARSLETADPFARQESLRVSIRSDLGERVLPVRGGHDLRDAWSRSWEDFEYAPPGGEPSLGAQARICAAIDQIAGVISGPAAVFTHGHVIGLLLNSLDATVGRAAAEALRNPDVLCVESSREGLRWHREFALPELERIATPHARTPWEE
jgi:2,3-bisphosphoglycerate-dependent phosphoglycerate mutase